MILRGAIFTAERRHLGAQSVPGVTASPAVGPAVDTPHVSGEELAATYEVPAPEAPPLSSDRVASWLVTQDGATRTAVAWKSRLGDRTLTFYASESSPDTATFKDKETGTR